MQSGQSSLFIYITYESGENHDNDQILADVYLFRVCAFARAYVSFHVMPFYFMINLFIPF